MSLQSYSASAARRLLLMFDFYIAYKRDEWVRITPLDEVRETAGGSVRITASSIYPI